ncbi:hypothetical protein SAMN04515667_1109 [Formosa sp. Hel1_31_208]|uniref:hypothetical protein n=1 Tax=Formosa sp. Hel1_31_208 TaxID=1798225 RepID=UPI000879948A|nr:hypothetical protein [Formosa sp. Hel1_31_208]SDR97090.1 hypothetical protein SAMN04515667_1109 [Formosa sp. Hel1_31_208]
MTFTDIQQKILHAPMLDFGQIFNNSIELFKKVWLQGLIMLLLTIAFAIPFVFIVYMPLILIGIADTVTNGNFETLAPIAMLFLIVAYLLFIFASMVVTFGLKAALYRIMRKKDSNDEGPDDYFYFLRKPYLGKTINLSLAYFGISLIAALLCFFPLIYVIVPLNLLIVIYAFNPDISTSDLIKASFELGNKKWLITFGLVIVAAILAQLVGMLMCGIGIFFTACFAYIPQYFIYKEVIGFDDNEMRFLGEEQDV